MALCGAEERHRALECQAEAQGARGRSGAHRAHTELSYEAGPCVSPAGFASALCSRTRVRPSRPPWLPWQVAVCAARREAAAWRAARSRGTAPSAPASVVAGDGQSRAGARAARSSRSRTLWTAAACHSRRPEASRPRSLRRDQRTESPMQRQSLCRPPTLRCTQCPGRRPCRQATRGPPASHRWLPARAAPDASPQASRLQAAWSRAPPPSRHRSYAGCGASSGCALTPRACSLTVSRARAAAAAAPRWARWARRRAGARSARGSTRQRGSTCAR